MNDEDPSISNSNSTPPVYAGFLRRFGAALIDVLVLSPLIGLNYLNTMYIKSILLIVVFGLIAIAYKPYLEWKNEWTYGKKFMKLRVVDESFGRMTLDQSILRSMPWIISSVISMIASVLVFLSPDFEDVATYTDFATLVTETPLQGFSTSYNFVFMFLVGYLVIDKRHQGGHDKLAKTFCLYDEHL